MERGELNGELNEEEAGKRSAKSRCGSRDRSPAHRSASQTKEELHNDNADQQDRPNQEIPFSVLPFVSFHLSQKLKVFFFIIHNGGI